MKSLSTPRNLLIAFYILVGYVCLQFFWWMYLLLKLNATPSTTLMVIGEGSVFLIILLLGALFIWKSYKKQIDSLRQQQNFSLAITHELKSPLAAIQLQLQTLQKRKLDETQQQNSLQRAVQDTKRLHQLIDDILLSNQLEKDNLNQLWHKSNQNISTLCLQYIYTQYQNISRIQTFITPDVYANVDSSAFLLIVSNLVDNALKYSSITDKVSITLAQDKDIVLTITDTGSGIADIEKAKVFSKFYRGKEESTRTTTGTGLGLFIVKNSVKFHDATIKLVDNSPNGLVVKVIF